MIVLGEKMFRQFLLFCLFGFAISCSSSKVEYKKQNSIKMESSENDDSKFLSVDEVPTFKERQYFIAPGFLLQLSHPSDDKLNGRFRVSYDGILRLPYGVRVSTDGLNLTNLREKVREGYTRFFQKGVNKVDLKIVYKQFYVEIRGFVEKPGRYLVTRNESIDRVIDQAGGIKGDLNKDFYSALIKQQGEAYSISLNKYYEDITFSKAITWTGADQIFINLLNDDAADSALPMVTVLGGVNGPGKHLFKKNQDIYYYLNKSGGLVSTINLEEAYIMRTTKEGIQKIQFNLASAEQLPAIEKNDVIMVNSEQRTAWDRFLQRSSQIAGIFASIAILIIAF